MKAAQETVLWLDTVGRADIAKVGGKNASSGELLRNLQGKGILVPPGFATSADAYRCFVDANGLRDTIRAALDDFKGGVTPLAEAGLSVRRAFLRGVWPEQIATAIREAYREFSRRAAVENVAVAVRSSATAEDLPSASFAGQQETFLNVRGEQQLLQACKRCFASLFTDRSIHYRVDQGFDHFKVSLSIAVMKMVRADLGASGIMF